MSKPPLRYVAIALLAAVPILWLAGPRWPGTYARLLCGESWTVRATYDDRPTCEVPMNAANGDCVCEDVRGSWSPFYYLVLIPLVLIHGLLFLMPRLIIGTVSVLGVVMFAVMFMPYAILPMLMMGVPIPRLMQGMAIAWPQLVLFPAVLQTGAGKVIPYEMSNWGFAVSMFVWALLGMAFGALVTRLRTRWTLPLAVAFVAGVTLGLIELAPLLGWKYLLEFP